MLPSESIGAAIRAANAEGRAAIVGFLTAGFPHRDTFLDTLAQVASAADVVEIGVPFSDPMADGMTIQRSSRVALEQGVSLRFILDALATASRRPATPLLLMSYLNPLLAYGFEALAARAIAAGVAGFIIPDLPFEESADIRSTFESAGIALVQLVTPVTPEERLARLCAASSGFVYAVTMTGTTGRSVEVPDEVLAYLDRVRRHAPIPVCAGFGIRNAGQIARMQGHVDGVIVGSALVEVLERGEDPGAYLRALRPVG